MSAAARRNGPYAPLSATYADDDAVIEAGEAAELLFVRGLAFLATSNSNGYITKAQLTRRVGAGMNDAPQRAERLVEVGLWEAADGGYVCRSWLKWNRSAEELGHARAKDRERKAGRRTEESPPMPPSGLRAESERNPAGSRAESDGSPSGVQPDSDASHAEARRQARADTHAPPRGGAQANHFTSLHDTPPHVTAGHPRASAREAAAQQDRGIEDPGLIEAAQAAAAPTAYANPPRHTGDPVPAARRRAQPREHPATAYPRAVSDDRPMALAGIADELVTEYAATFDHTLPRRFRVALHGQVDSLLAEGFTRDQVRSGLILLSQKPKAGAGLLPNLVHEALSSPPARASGQRPMSRSERSEDVLARYEQALKGGSPLPDPFQTCMPIVIEGQVAS